jgi:hypothetical protein
LQKTFVLAAESKGGAMFLFEEYAAWRRTTKGKNREPGLQKFYVSKIIGRRVLARK